MVEIRSIQEDDDTDIAAIIRANLESYGLDVPGTAYFDPELNHLSRYYLSEPEQRDYLIAADNGGQVIGGVGIARSDGFEQCAELQKLYVADTAKGKGTGSRLLAEIQNCARRKGYWRLYLETHSALKPAIRLYERDGFVEIGKPDCVFHSAMDRFFMKNL